MTVYDDPLVGGAVQLGLYELLRQRVTKRVRIANPAAGADWSTVVPAGVAWEVLNVNAVLATSAVVANRSPRFVVLNPDGVQEQTYNPAAAVAAGVTQRQVWTSGLGTAISANVNSQPLSGTPIACDAGSTLQSSTFNLDVGDQWSGIILVVREWALDELRQHAGWFERHIT